MDTITIYGKPDCVDYLRSKALLDGFEVPFHFHNIAVDEDAASRAQLISGGSSSPVIVFPDGSFQREPTDFELAIKLGKTPPNEVGGDVCETSSTTTDG